MNFVIEADFITSSATKKRFKIRRDFGCNSRYVVYCASCTLCLEQCVGSTVNWKPRLANYKSHISNGHENCGIVNHFLTQCHDTEDPTGHLVFHILDGLDNILGLSEEERNDLLLQKEKFWIGTLLTMHKGMNSTHDWNRTKRCEKL